LRLVLHREIPQDDGLRRHWNDLVQRMEAPEVFYTYEWALAVSRAYHASIAPLLMLGYEQDSLVGVAALATGNARREGFFLAGTTADYCDFVSAAESRQELVNAVLTELRKLGMPTLVLANLPTDSATGRTLGPSAGFQGYNLFSQPAFRCSQVLLRTAEQRESIRRLVRHKRERRYLKALAAKVPVELDHLTLWEEIDPALPLFSKAHVARMSTLGRVSHLASPERVAFLSELAKLLSPQALVTLSHLRAGDQPIAWLYTFRFARHLSFYQMTFDSNFREYSPGSGLRLRVVEEACDSPETDFIDLGLGGEHHKQRWANGCRETVNVTVTRSTVRHVRGKLRYHMATAIKSSPRLEHHVRWLLGKPASRGTTA
jgi:CelD/BcsL family acetyltransferase involved in cellulose biosynthesis